MKLVRDSTPVQRSKSLRSQPYDLRRRVLVKNFLNDQQPANPVTRPPTPKIPYQLQQHRSLENIRRSLNYGEEESACPVEPSETVQPRALVQPSGKFDHEVNDSSNGIIQQSENESNDDFLYLISRRLRSSETANLRKPYRKSRSVKRHRPSKMRLAESQENLISDCAPSPAYKRGIFKSSKRTPKSVPKLRTSEYVLRSYPTFSKLNEICACDSDTYKKTILAIRGSRTKDVKKTPILTTAMSNTKIKRTSSLRRSISKMLRQKTSDSYVMEPSTNVKENVSKLEKKPSFVSKLFSPFSTRKESKESVKNSPNLKEKPRSSTIPRSTSLRTPPTPGAPKLRRRAQSVRLQCVRLDNDAF